MRARLTILIKEIDFFFNTVCDMEITSGKAIVNFSQQYHSETIHNTIGFSDSKIFIMRKLIGNELDISENESFYVISDEAMRTRRVAMDIGSMSLFLFADGMKIDITDCSVTVEIKCFMSLDGKKADEYLLELECYCA